MAQIIDKTHIDSNIDKIKLARIAVAQMANWINGLFSDYFENGGYRHLSIGIGAMPADRTNSYGNTAIGQEALASNTTGNYNTAIGSPNLQNNTTGGENTAVGSFSMPMNTTGFSNTAFGRLTLYRNTTGYGNSALGTSSLENNDTGLYNTGVGRSALDGVTNFSNCSGFGFNAQVTGSSQVQLGNSATTTYVYGTVQNRSDLRDKADVRDTVLGLDFIKALRPVDYKWDMREDYRPERPADLQADATDEERAAHRQEVEAWIEACKHENIVRDGSKKRNRYHHGLIAQEVKETLDSLGIDFGGYQDHKVAGGGDVLSIGYDELIAPLIKAVQQLSEKVEILEQQLSTNG